MPPANDNNALRLFLFRSTAVMLMVLLSSAGAIYEESRNLQDWGAQTLRSVAAIVLFNLCYAWSMVALYRERQRQLLMLLWLEAALVCYLFFGAREIIIAHYYGCFWVARTSNSYRLRTCLWLTAGLLILAQIAASLRQAEWPFWAVFIIAPFYYFVLSVSFTAVNERRLRGEAVALNRELKEAQDLLAQMSRQSERLRIARDMHDLLGHQMTALLLNLEVASHKTEGPALDNVKQCQAVAKTMLGDLRNAVSELRDKPLDFHTALATMLTRIPELKITLDLQHDITITDPRTAEILLRCTQEALTNTLRHARASHCHIRLYAQHGRLVLEISDDGISQQQIVPGNGLKGMRERLQQLAGHLRWQNREGSFVLEASLPLPESRA
jgi:signal transduction histidine kinase